MLIKMWTTYGQLMDNSFFEKLNREKGKLITIMSTTTSNTIHTILKVGNTGK